MTSHVYRYRQGAPFTTAELQKIVHASATITDAAGGPTVDITCDDSRLADLDEYMARKGYPTRVSTDPGTTPPSETRFANGTIVPWGTPSSGQILQYNGTNIVGTTAGATTDLRDLIVWDHFISGNVDLDELANMGWRINATGTGNAQLITGEAGHPGIIRLQAGTASTGRSAIELGEGQSQANIILGGTNPMVYEALVSFRGSVSSTYLRRHQFGLGDGWSLASPNNLTDGVYFRLEPGVSTSLFGVVRSGGSETTRNLGTVPVTGNWYRVGFTYTTGTGVQFRLNGTDQGAVVNTNVPTALISPGFRADSAGGATNPELWADYVLLTQVTNKET